MTESGEIPSGSRGAHSRDGPGEGGPWREGYPLEPEPAKDTTTAGDAQRRVRGDILLLLPCSYTLVFQQCLPVDPLCRKLGSQVRETEQGVAGKGWSEMTQTVSTPGLEDFACESA